MAHARALSALIAPTVNCYKRLSIGAYLTGARSGFTWTPAFITYGDNNRTQMFRTPDPGRFECRVVSGAVNPYLGLAGFIAAGIDGIERELDPGEPQIGTEHVRDAARRGPQRGPPVPPAERCPRRSTSSRRDEVVQGGARAGAGRRVPARQAPRSGCATTATVGRWEIDQYLTLF